MATRDSKPMRRDAYHHGDLRNALTDAATDLAKTGGPEAVVLREAARTVGVSATAAYRHFASHAELIHAVKQRALGYLADSMQAELDALDPTGDPARDAEARLGAVGTGYVRFALAEPGLFRIAFDSRDMHQPKEGESPGGDTAYGMLTRAVDDLVATGVLPEGRRPLSETAAWSAVHGLAVLLGGPLSWLPEQEREAAIARIGDMVLHGL